MEQAMFVSTKLQENSDQLFSNICNSLIATSLEFEDFASNEIPPYASLSHTWGREEVLFADLGKIEAQGKEGYQKIKHTCRQALQDGLQYAWIDTCCTDKSSSAELSEVINSMCAQYADADVCYAYPSDVAEIADIHDTGSEFARSRWFTRGWTLQELLAPKSVVFFTVEWIKSEKDQSGSKVEKDQSGSKVEKGQLPCPSSCSLSRVLTRKS